ncbi:MAG TPA: chemotaxis protein CheX [Mycobacteriales bacterium]|nr:chemotaxis protein CheX [Mycobacteriales bacterium]
MTSPVLPDTYDVEQIVGEVFGSFLGGDDTMPIPVASSEGDPTVAASVSITGGWSGHVVFGCSESASRIAAAHLLMMSEDELADADIADAVGELANMIGGNIKSLLPGPSALTLPLVSLGGAALHLPSSTEAVRLDLTWQGQPVRVSVWASTADAQEGTA